MYRARPTRSARLKTPPKISAAHGARPLTSRMSDETMLFESRVGGKLQARMDAVAKLQLQLDHALQENDQMRAKVQAARRELERVLVDGGECTERQTAEVPELRVVAREEGRRRAAAKKRRA